MTETTSGRLRKKKILVVEDDRFLGDLLTQKLQSEEAEVFRAENAEEALKHLSEAGVDIVLLDLVLPTMSGYDLLKQIKADDRLKSIPVIVLSNLGKEKDLEQANKLGVTKYLVKVSVSPAEIVGQIIETLGA